MAHPARFSSTLVTVALALCASATLRAQNLVQNGEFSSDLSHWTSVNSFPGDVYRSGQGFDGDFEPQKGSVVINEGRPGFNQFADVRQCVTAASLPSNLTFRVYAWAAGVAGTGAGIDAEAILFNYGSTNCTGSPLGSNDYRLAVAGGPLQYSANPQGPGGLTRWKRLWFSYPPPAGTKSVLVILQVIKRLPDALAAAGFDDVFLGAGLPAESCARNDNSYQSGSTNCLRYNQFRVTADWKTADGGNGHATAVPLTEDSGSFWFFNPNNLEIIVKVLNGCGLNNRYWVFAGGLTSVEVTLTVTDTHSGQVKTYKNPLNHTFTPFQDTGAFATCP